MYLCMSERRIQKRTRREVVLAFDTRIRSVRCAVTVVVLECPLILSMRLALAQEAVPKGAEGGGKS
jgi:hypothetical protein